MKSIKKPSLFLMLTEGIRYFIDLIKLFFFLAKFQYPPKGDGHPVLVVPGLTCTDFSTILLRRFIKRLGYTPYGWNLGRNMGDLVDLKDIKRLKVRVDEIRQNHNEKITLIGWSMGGIYTRELAKMYPDLFHQVITMGSPFADSYAPNNVEWFYNLIAEPEKVDKNWRDQLPNPAQIKTTAIYSKEDGLVPWEACMEKEDVLHINYEVTGSHWGFVVNRAVFQIIAAALPYAIFSKQDKNNLKKEHFV